MAQAQVEMAVAIAWAARAAEAEAEAAWLRLQPSPEGGLQPSLGRTTWRATEAPRFARSEEVRATRTSVAFVHRLRKKKSVTVSVQFRRGPPELPTPLTFTRFSPPQHTRCVAVYDIYKAGRSCVIRIRCVPCVYFIVLHLLFRPRHVGCLTPTPTHSS